MGYSITFIRHGQSEGNVNPSIYLSKHDSELCLTDVGKSQSIEISQKYINNWKYLKTKNIHIYHSSYNRTIETFDHFRKGLIYNIEDKNIHESILLREWETHQCIENPLDTYDFMIKNNKLNKSGFFFRFDGGESLADLELRCRLFLIELDKIEDNSHIFIFCHSFTELMFMKIINNISVEDFFKISHLKNCEFVSYYQEDSGFVLNKKQSNAKNQIESFVAIKKV